MTETFGHEPMDEYAGTPEGDQGISHIVCARCMRWVRWPEVGLSAGARIPWPCGTAVLLGIVELAEASR